MQQNSEFPRTEGFAHGKLTINPRHGTATDPLCRQRADTGDERRSTSKQTREPPWPSSPRSEPVPPARSAPAQERLLPLPAAARGGDRSRGSRGSQRGGRRARGPAGGCRARGGRAAREPCPGAAACGGYRALCALPPPAPPAAASCESRHSWGAPCPLAKADPADLITAGY